MLLRIPGCLREGEGITTWRNIVRIAAPLIGPQILLPVLHIGIDELLGMNRVQVQVARHL
jgi:hypothetical protein